MDRSEKIFVAGHRGLVGGAVVRLLEAEGFTRLLKRDRRELDLTDERAVDEFFRRERPAIVIFAAAKVGG
ncbi:MAG: NAD-dependent epimerase/dehydratase family protein, partial [Chthoniobacterales bacterium]